MGAHWLRTAPRRSKVPMSGALGSPPAEAMPNEMDKGTLTSEIHGILMGYWWDIDGILMGSNHEIYEIWKNGWIEWWWIWDFKFLSRLVPILWPTRMGMWEPKIAVENAMAICQSRWFTYSTYFNIGIFQGKLLDYQQQRGSKTWGPLFNPTIARICSFFCRRFHIFHHPTFLGHPVAANDSSQIGLAICYGNRWQ